MGNPLIDLLVAIIALCGAIGVIGMLRTGSLYDRIGEGGFASPTPHPEPQPDSPAAIAEREAEVRQMLQARSDRRMRQGEPALDVEAEVARLLASPSGSDGPVDAGAHRHDPQLVEELRQLAEARNQRRMRQGKEPLDVRAEVERALAELDV